MKTSHDGLVVAFRVGRPQGTGLQKEEEIRMDFYDEVSGVSFMSVEMSHETFSQALGSLQVTCKATLRALDRVGTQYQNKVEFVPIPEKYKEEIMLSKAATQECLEPFEVDGWKARRGDFGNHHRYAKQRPEGSDDDVRGYHVNFGRHVGENGSPVL